MILGLTPFAKAGSILFGTASSEAASAIVSPLIRDVSYRTNRSLGPLLPLMPDIAALVKLYHKGRLDSRELFQCLAYHGIDPLSEIWSKLVSSSGNFPDLDTFLRNYNRGLIEEDHAQFLRGQLGIRDQAAWSVLSRNAYPWTPDEVRQLLSVGAFEEVKYRGMLKSSGLLHPDDRVMFESLYQPTSPAETLALLNRKELSPAEADEFLKLAGLTEDKPREAFKKLANSIPGPADLVRFAVKEVWTRDVVDRFGYDAEYPDIPAFREWMSRSGMGGTAAIPELGAGQPESWAQAYWRAHWRTISPTQAYTMLHRLRPTGGPNGGPRVPSFTFVEGGQERTVPVPPVTIADVESILKINDYPPAFRARLAAISYLPFRLVDIRQIVYLASLSAANRSEMVGDGISVREWATQQFMDRGQTRERASVLASVALATAHKRRQYESDRRHKTATRGRTGQALKLYDVGLKTREETRVTLNALFMDNQEVNDTLAYIEGKWKYQDTMEQIKWVQKQVVKGYVHVDMGLEILKKVGLIPDAVERYRKKWLLLLDEGARISETTEALQQFRMNLVGYDETLQRLINLGWDNAQEILDSTPYQDFVEPGILQN